jgi:outer membrane lipopolysaccharide assembly protein LptE/RlpB
MRKVAGLFGSLLIVSAVALSGCGYTTRSSFIAKSFKTIYIQPFVNKTDITGGGYAANKYRIYRPALETDISRTVTNRFLFDGNLRLAKEEEADLVLKGELLDYRKDPLAYNNDNTEVTEYRVNIVVNITLWDRKENKLLWQENNFTGESTYFTSFASGNAVVTSEETAITATLKDLARRIVERTVEEW